MKIITITITLVVFIVSLSVVYASDNSTDSDHWEKVRQMDQLAERFKAETGFTGEINPNGALTHLTGFRGKFNDILFSASADTTAFRQASERIIDKLLPYTLATRKQLTKDKILKNSNKYETMYYQSVGGYKVESRGLILIKFDVRMDIFSISNGTVELPVTKVTPIVTYEEAVRIYDEHVEDDEAVKNLRKRRPFLHLSFCNIYNDWEGDTRSKYQLCWFGGYTRHIYIDAITGRVYKTVNKAKHDYAVHVTSQVMLDSDNTGSTNTVSVSLDGTWVSAVCDSIPDPKIRYTDSNGDCSFVCNTITDIESYLSSENGIEVNQNNGNTVKQNSPILELPNLIFDYTNVDGNPSNLYYHALRFRDKIKSLVDCSNSSCYYGSTIFEPTILANYSLATGVNGLYVPGTAISSGSIKISSGNGNFSSALCHEMTHDMISRSLMYNNFNNSVDEDLDCMDEAFSSYFPCMYRNNKTYRSALYIKDLSDSTLTVGNAAQTEYTGIAVNENIYSYYHMRFPLAAAWWSLKDNTCFGYLAQDPSINRVDSLLVMCLGDVFQGIVDQSNDDYRYKPRYFYNILMDKVNPSQPSWDMNDKQLAINAAYNSRGFHFYPEVRSVVSGNNEHDKNFYSLADSVYVHITNCPQNTKVKIIVVPHDSTYVQIGKDGRTIPSGVMVSSNNQSYEVGQEETTDSSGEWRGGINYSDQMLPGEYDIIVNVGSDPNCPDGNLHLVFAKDNVIDGVDGLDDPGFVKTDWGDAAVALDLSSSMEDYGSQLTQSVQALVASMLPSEKVNVFGFTEGTASQAWENGVTNIIGGEDDFEEAGDLDSLQINNIMSSVSIGGNTDLCLPFSHGYGRLGYLPNSENRNIILLSDGIHFVTPEHEGNSGNSDHTLALADNLITSLLIPADIWCYTICYGNSDEGIANMRRFAELGNGKFYHAYQLRDVKVLMNQLLCNIRGSAPALNVLKSIEPGLTQSHEIVVEPQASALKTTVVWDADATGGGIAYMLVSPSGVAYHPGNNGTAGTLQISNPESGIWQAIVTNTSYSPAKYSLVCDARSDINLSVAELPVSHPIDKPLLVSVTVKNYRTPISGSSVRARLSRDNWQTEVTLYDDGNHNDQTANDGIYANYLCSYAGSLSAFPDPEGAYSLEVVADMPSVQARRNYVQQIYLESTNSVTYPVNNRIFTKGWNWQGFPRLSEYEGGSSIPIATLSLNPHLSQVVSAIGSATCTGSAWNYDGLTQLNPQSGYKLLIGGTDQAVMYDVGAIVDTTIAYSLVGNEWNWVTYPCFTPAYPEEALTNVIDDVDYILGQNWSMKKENGVWVKDVYSHTPVLRYGDSVLIHALDDSDLFWTAPAEPIEPALPISTSHFTYDDKPEYETLIIESITTAYDLDIKEVGVFQNQVCVGARTVEGYPCHVLVYSDINSKENSPLSIRAYTSAQEEIILTPIDIWTEQGTQDASGIDPEYQGFRHLTLQVGETVPPVLAMSQNYPNPFNPSTTIRYAVPTEGKVKLTIYNIKGQRVRELVHATLTAGYHSAVWDGRDSNGRIVGSGVYFAKLEHNKTSKLQKMMLIK